MRRLAIILALGAVAHGAVLRALGVPAGGLPFRHGVLRPATPRLTLADSYHCSRLNTNTGRLTEAMFRDVIASVRERLARPGASRS